MLISRSELRSTLVRNGAVVAACGLGIAAFAIDLVGHLDAALRPRSDAWSASVAALLSYSGLHAVALSFFAAFVVARSMAGLLSPQHRSALDCARLCWHASTAQALAATAVIQLLPRIVG